MLMDEDKVKGDKRDKILIWCLQSRSAGATWAMLVVLLNKGHSQAVIVRATVRTFKRFSFCPDLILAGGIPEHTATLWIVASASSGWFCHQLSTATMFLSMVCLVGLSSFRLRNQVLYFASLSESTMLLSNHWLLLPGLTNSWAGSKAAGLCPWNAASIGDCTRAWGPWPSGVGTWEFGAGGWLAAASSVAILASNSAILCWELVSAWIVGYHRCSWSPTSFARLWMASSFPRPDHLEELCAGQVYQGQFHGCGVVIRFHSQRQLG